MRIFLPRFAAADGFTINWEVTIILAAAVGAYYQEFLVGDFLKEAKKKLPQNV